MGNGRQDKFLRKVINPCFLPVKFYNAFFIKPQNVGVGSYETLYKGRRGKKVPFFIFNGLQKTGPQPDLLRDLGVVKSLLFSFPFEQGTWGNTGRKDPIIGFSIQWLLIILTHIKDLECSKDDFDVCFFP